MPRIFRRRAAGGRHRYRELVQDEVPAGAPAAGAVLGKAWVGQHFQQHSPDSGKSGLGIEGDGVVDRVDPGGQDRAVRQVGVA